MRPPQKMPPPRCQMRNSPANAPGFLLAANILLTLGSPVIDVKTMLVDLLLTWYRKDLPRISG